MGRASIAGRRASGLVRAADDPRVLDEGGFWVVLITFEGEVRLWQFAEHEPATGLERQSQHQAEHPSQHQAAREDHSASSAGVVRAWPGVEGPWHSSLDERGYAAAVAEVRRRIREGEVYQVNICRVLSAALPSQDRQPALYDPWALAEVLARGNPAPYAGVIDVPAMGPLPRTRVVSASPELFLSRQGEWIASSPIKGTGRTAADLQPKDRAENIMIVDLVRNDLQHVCRPGTVEVDGLLRVEQHPGLVHLVSTVRGRLNPDADWQAVLAATMPPGSVSGAPKSSALRAIADLETAPRGPYCGAIGWIDADAGEACLAVGIRTFWWHEDALGAELRFGTGAGITWDSDPHAEWAETELKAARLIALAQSPQRNHHRE